MSSVLSKFKLWHSTVLVSSTTTGKAFFTDHTEMCWGIELLILIIIIIIMIIVIIIIIMIIIITIVIIIIINTNLLHKISIPAFWAVLFEK